jgi:predicted Zn-dependent protease with MMP-like domain
MEGLDDFTGAEILTALALETASALGGIVIGRKLREQGAALPAAVAVGVGATMLGVKASTNLVEKVSKNIRPLDQVETIM